MTLFEYFVEIRSDMLHVISGVENARGYFGWDDTTPNYSTKMTLKHKLDNYIDLASEHGVYIVTRYSSCGNPNHEEYPTENRYGLNISYKDEKYIWSGHQFYQGVRNSNCPCSAGNKYNDNNVIDEFVYDKNVNERDCENIALILEDIHWAMRLSSDKKTRSSIREYLLRAVLKANDAILPFSVDEYISYIQRINA